MATHAAAGDIVSAALPSPWSPQQRRWLQALGHVVMHTGDAVAAAEPAPTPTSAPFDAMPMADAGPAAPQRPVAVPSPPYSPPPRAPAPPLEVPVASAPSGTAARAGSMRRPAQMPGRQQLALLRASGLDPADPATVETMAQWPVEQLRADAAAKRAFWPRLRALRKRSP